MALYIAKITVPPNTPETNPIEVKVPVEGRYLEKIEYRFPAGCFEAVKVRVMYGNRVISPKGKYKWVDGEISRITREGLARAKTKCPWAYTAPGSNTWKQARIPTPAAIFR